VIIPASLVCQKHFIIIIAVHQASMGAGIEMPVDSHSRLAVGAVGMGFSVLLFFVASFRLGKFCKAYGWKLREVMG
jgi:hypothetical protein